MKLKLDKVRFYGDLHETNTNMIRQIINELIMFEYLAQTNSEYPVLIIGERYKELTKESKIIIKLPKDIEIERKASKPSKVNKIGISYQDVDNNLFENLRILRRQLAKEQNVPPYIVFSDKSLVEMAAYKPINKDQMLRINGVGEVKYEKYGELFINVIKDFAELNLGEDSVNNTEELPDMSEENANDNMSFDRVAYNRSLNRPDGAGKSWDDEEDKQLIDEFNSKYHCDFMSFYSETIKNDNILIENGYVKAKNLGILNNTLINFMIKKHYFSRKGDLIIC